MSTRRTLTNRELQGRLDDLEGALNDERTERLAQGAEHDEDIEGHAEKLTKLGETLQDVQEKIRHIVEGPKRPRPKRRSG